MKRGSAFIALLVLIAATLYLWPSAKKPTPTTVAPVKQNSSPSRTNSSTVVESLAVASPASNTSAINSSPSPAQTPVPAPQAGELKPDASASTVVGPETALQNMQRAVHQYGQMFGGNPVGTNPEITSQLNGDNPKHINFINPQPGAHIDAEGELVDQWGTPYFFHQLSGSQMEIHSAGPDKIMWTSDDLVVK
jgi:hypothetical protein